MKTRSHGNLLLALLLIGSALSAAPQVSAQPSTPRPSGAEVRAFDLEQQLESLRTRLALDPGQTQQVRVILEDARRRMQATRPTAGAPHDPAVGELRRQILWDVEDRIWALLSCPQKDAFRLYQRERMLERRAIHAERRAGHRGDRGRGGHGGGRPGPRGHGPGSGPGAGSPRP